MIDSPIS